MPLVIEGHDLEWRGEGRYTIQSAHKGAGFGYWPGCGRYASTRGCSITWGLDSRTSRGDCLIGSQGSWVASFVGAHVSLEGRARFGTCLGKRSNGGSRSESCWNGGAALDETATDAARADGATPGVAGARPRAPANGTTGWNSGSRANSRTHVLS